MTRSLILLAHGSPDSRHADTVDTIAERVSRELGPEWTVSTSYLQHHGPTVTDTFGTARQSDNLAVAIQPLLLTAGEHWRRDVPILTEEVTSKPGVELLEPLDPVGLRTAVLEVLAPYGDSIPPGDRVSFEDDIPFGDSVSSEDDIPFGDSPAAGEPTGNTTMSSWPPMPIRRVVLVAGGSRIQDLWKHFEPLAAEVERILGQSLANQGGTQARSVPIDLLARPSEILKLRSSGPGTWIVPLLVSRGRVYDSMVNAADQMGAKVTRPVGEAKAFASELAARALTNRNRHGGP